MPWCTFVRSYANESYANTIRVANMQFAVFDNELGIMVNIADYDTDSHVQAEKRPI